MARRSKGFFKVKLTLSTLLAIAVLSVLWLTLGQGEQLPSIVIGKQESIIKHYASNVIQRNYDNTGSAVDNFSSEEIHEYTQDPKVYFSNIVAERSEPGEDSWVLVAANGVYRPYARELWLHNGVTIEQKNEGSQKLQTPRMRVLLDEDRAVNNAFVELHLADSKTTAYGLDLDLNTKIAKLLKNVTTVYEH